jgi:two-component system sensor histidine kinase KdpD
MCREIAWGSRKLPAIAQRGSCFRLRDAVQYLCIGSQTGTFFGISLAESPARNGRTVETAGRREGGGLKPGKLHRLFPFSWRDCWVTAAILICAVLVCRLLRMVDASGEFASLIFVLAVLLVSRLTTGYLFGLLASVLGVVGVNWMFTYPYLQIDFTIAGYPLSFLTMLVVSIITSTMTTQVKQQEQLRLENEKEKLRANLLRSVSHDIRTPLTSIVGATSAVLENADTLSRQEQQRLLEDVRDEAQGLIRMVENLLSVTRMGDDGARITKTAEAAEEVMGEAVRKFRKRFPGTEVLVTAPEELLMVPMDAVLIEQVLTNLLENAVFHGVHTTRIRLSVRAERGYARFSVQDNGAGIRPELLPVLFAEPYRTCGERGDQGRHNMGLGLTVCTAIVRAHGGRMGARNLPGGGAEVSFSLPLREEESNENPRKDPDR